MIVFHLLAVFAIYSKSSVAVSLHVHQFLHIQNEANDRQILKIDLSFSLFHCD